MLSKLMPKEGKFHELFIATADRMIDGCRLFEEMLQNLQKAETFVQDIKKVESDCDDLVHKIFNLINTVFITPIDREDIQTLIATMDDVIDNVEGAAQRFLMYEIVEVPPGLLRMARLTSQAVCEMKGALNILADMKHSQRALQHCIEINRLENEQDSLIRQSISRLFRERKDDPLLVIKYKEVYEKIENAVDRCEDVANVITTIAIKHT